MKVNLKYRGKIKIGKRFINIVSVEQIVERGDFMGKEIKVYRIRMEYVWNALFFLGGMAFGYLKWYN